MEKLGKYNMLVKGKKGMPYIITDMIATRLTKGEVAKLQALNKDLLGEYRFVAYKDTDFTWWGKTTKYLTKGKISTNKSFYVDCYGMITKFD